MKRILLLLSLPFAAWAPVLDNVQPPRVPYAVCMEDTCWPRVSRCLDNPKGHEQILQKCWIEVYRPCRYVCYWNWRENRIRDQHGIK